MNWLKINSPIWGPILNYCRRTTQGVGKSIKIWSQALYTIRFILRCEWQSDVTCVDFYVGSTHMTDGHHFKNQLECWQLTCQFPTCRSLVLCSFDRDNSMYEQQTWMLTLGLLNRNTGCQCCSVRCLSMLKLCISIHSLDFSKFHHYAKFRRNRLNCGLGMVIFRFFKMVAAAILDF